MAATTNIMFVLSLAAKYHGLEYSNKCRLEILIGLEFIIFKPINILLFSNVLICRISVNGGKDPADGSAATHVPGQAAAE